MKKEKLYGINTVKIEEAESIGFAIPINIVKPIIERIKEERKLPRSIGWNICI